MKKYIYIAIICLSTIGCKELKHSNAITISVIQNGKVVQPINGTVTLDKAPFNLVFNFSEPNFILVNATFNNDLMFKALNGESLVTQPQLGSGNIIAETYFNTEKSIYASNESSSAWLQESEDKHMLNDLEIKNGMYTGTRIIEHIFDLDTNTNTLVEDMNMPMYLVFVVIDKNTEFKNTIELQREAIKIEWTGNNTTIEEKPNNNSFNSLISDFRVRNLPVLDSTNFDSSIEVPYFFSAQEINMLQLKKVYPNYDTEGYNYRTTPSYKIYLSENYISLVFTSYIGDHEMESVLVNYELDGLLIDYEVIAYDEIAESLLKIESTIENNILTTNYINWVEEKKQVESTLYQIKANGEIEDIPLDAIHIDSALEQLNLDISKVNTDLLVTKINPSNPQEIIMVIPEFVDTDEDEYDFKLNCYIILINSTTGKITHNYKSNGWTSDAIQLTQISIDTAPYLINENTRAFGIRANYYVLSHVNPYNNKILSLFVKSEDTLKRVLDNYDVLEYRGEWDGICYGEFLEEKKELIISDEKTNGYFNIIVKNTITETKSNEDEDGECDAKDTVTIETSVLKYNTNTYSKE